MKFQDLKLIEPLLRTVKAEGYAEPTPIQEQAIPYVLEGRDILGCAQTGTGKTAAFALPIIQQLLRRPSRQEPRPIRALVLTPTRELAAQIGESFATYGRNTGIRFAVVFGGVNQQPQTASLKRGVDVLIATPGRLLDLSYQGLIDYYALEVFVLDEADRMLDMGFIRDVRKIVDMLPEKRQTLFFSATMEPEIRKLADNILRDPVSVTVTPPCSTVDLIEQSVYFVEKQDKPDLLAYLFEDPALKRVLIFTRTKYGADKVARILTRRRIRTEAIHGNKTQNARERALDSFKHGRVRALVATDIASRGIDVENISHVINYDLPNEPESYVHRIGRTGRAGESGIAISLCDTSERPYLLDIERLIKKWIRHEEDHPFKSPLRPPPPADLEPRGRQQAQKQKSGSQPGRRGGRGRHFSSKKHAGHQNPHPISTGARNK